MRQAGGIFWWPNRQSARGLIFLHRTPPRPAPAPTMAAHRQNHGAPCVSSVTPAPCSAEWPVTCFQREKRFTSTKQDTGGTERPHSYFWTVACLFSCSAFACFRQGQEGPGRRSRLLLPSGLSELLALEANAHNSWSSFPLTHGASSLLVNKMFCVVITMQCGSCKAYGVIKHKSVPNLRPFIFAEKPLCIYYSLRWSGTINKMSFTKTER